MATISRHFANTHLAESVDISAGRVLKTDFIHKFGRNPSVGGAPETIWQHGGIYNYLSSASTVFVSSNDADDNPTGNGAQTVTILGLDANYNQIEATQPVNNLVGTTEFLRVYRAFVASAGSTGTNEGNVIISTAAGGGGTVLADIGTIGIGATYGLGKTQLALYTVPAHCTGFLTKWNVGVGAYNSSATATLYTRLYVPNNGTFRTRDIMDVPGGFHTRDYQIPIKLPAKTDIEIRAIASTGSTISSSFDITLVRDR
jgi:hypothetical protein